MNTQYTITNIENLIKEFKLNGSLWELYKKTVKFNELASNIDKPLEVFLKDQIPRVIEEADEIKDGFNERDLVKVLDGCVDTLVCTFAILEKLKLLGVDINSGMVDTANNNLTKFPTEESVADASIEFYKEQGIETYKVFNSKYNVWAVKRASDDKTMKPVGYVPNDLTKAVPSDLRCL